MKIVVSEIPEDGIDIDDLTVVWADEDGKRVEAHLNAHVQKLDMDVIIRGGVTATLQHICSRCLADFSGGVQTELELVYRPAKELETGEAGLVSEELDTGFYTDDEIDIDEVAREQVLLNVPMKPLCSEECKGICPVCGVNRNEKDCGCAQHRVDPRLAVLEKLIEKGKKEQ